MGHDQERTTEVISTGSLGGPIRVGLLLLVGWLGSAQAADGLDPGALVRAAIDLACNARSPAEVRALLRELPVQGGITEHAKYSLIGWRRSLRFPDGRLTIERLAPYGNLRRISAQFDLADGDRPRLLVVADWTCTIHTARRLHYDAQGAATWLEELDAELNPTDRRHVLNPPVPVAKDPVGIPIAVVDTGVNYLLPQINGRLARDPESGLLGYDYWDLDRRPFDANPIRSPFFPGHHGTQIASLLLIEAPFAKLLPYRYPRPDMTRMAGLVEHAAAHGAKIMNLSLAGNRRSEWLAFYEAAKRHPEMLFIVAAGNNGRDLDRRPIYPAALPLDNLIAVTSATTSGHLTSGVNWGRKVVDVMVAAEGVAVIDFHGRRRFVSGSSYATVRVTALAACLLAAHPKWQAADLKASILGYARPPAQAGVVARGFIAEGALKRRGACAGLSLMAGI